NWVQLPLRVRRSLATLIVFLVGVTLIGAMLYAFIRPLVDQVSKFSDEFPTYVADARAGRGTIGHLVKKYKVDDWIERNKKKLQEGVTRFGTGALKVVRSVAVAAAILLTVMVLAFLMILHGPDMLSGAVG